MMAFMELTGPRRRRLKVALDSDALPKVNEFLRGFASRSRWDALSTDRLAAAGEETLAILQQDEDAATAGTVQQLAVAVHMEGGSAEIEFVTALEGGERGGSALATPATFIGRGGRCRRRMAAGSPRHRHRLLYLDLVARSPIQVRMIHKECLRGIHVLRLKDRIAPNVAVARRGT